ncbi:MAG: hypothetical protein J6B98_03680 [Bacilli bacterium]|nr:hypothetical protein [Bacilli bacterium]
MEKNKGTLITIIILLLVFIPCTIFGMIKHFEDQNKNREFYFNGKLHFYNGEVLLGTYECKTEKCGYAEYEEIDTEKKIETTLINNQYAFIKDGNDLFVQDVTTNTKILDFEEIKSYSIPIENNSYIAKHEGKWGVISLEPSILSVINYEYDDLYLNYNNTINELSLEKVIVKEAENYKIIKDKEEVFSTTNQIVEFTDNLIITLLEDGSYEIVDYDNKDYFSQDHIVRYLIIDNYLAIWTPYNLDLYSINEDSNTPVNYFTSYNAYAEIKLEKDKINIYEYDEIVESYEKTIEK